MEAPRGLTRDTITPRPPLSDGTDRERGSRRARPPTKGASSHQFAGRPPQSRKESRHGHPRDVVSAPARCGADAGAAGHRVAGLHLRRSSRGAAHRRCLRAFHRLRAGRAGGRRYSRCGGLGGPPGVGFDPRVAWDSTLEDLPSGYSDSLRRAVEGERPASTLVVCAAQVHHERTGQGLAAIVLQGFREFSARFGFEHVIVPLRPTMKARYPLTPISTYARWQRPDGLPVDPWLRTHSRMGARVLDLAPRSQVMTGTIAEWENWTEMQFPASGEYVIPPGRFNPRVRSSRTGC